MDDIELQAMSKANDAVKNLAEEQRVRVIQWLGARYLTSLSPRIITSGPSALIEPETPGAIEEEQAQDYDSFAEMLAIVNNDQMSTPDRLLLAAYWLQVKEKNEKWQGYQLTKLLKPAGFPLDHPIRSMENLMSTRPAKMFQNGRDASKGRNAEFYSLTPIGISAAETIIGGKLVGSLDDVDSSTNNQPKQPKKPRPPKSKESLSIVKDLDLSEKSNDQSLRSFYDEKKPSSEMAKVTVFTYYLEKIAKLDAVTLNHIYSCYKDVNVKVPTNLKQTALNAASRKGWIDTSSIVAIKVATPGENYVEFDLPGKEIK